MVNLNGTRVVAGISVVEAMKLSPVSTIHDAMAWFTGLTPSEISKIAPQTFFHGVIGPGDIMYFPMAYMWVDKAGASKATHTDYVWLTPNNT